MNVIETSKGPIDAAHMECTKGITDGTGCEAHWTEWKYGGELVRRDVNLVLLRGDSLGADGGLS